MNSLDRIPVGNNLAIYKRGKKGTYCADYWQDGQHRRQSLKTTNLKVAIERATKVSVSLVDGTHAKPISSMLIAKAIAAFLAYLETEHRARKTRTKYKGILTYFAELLAELGIQRLDRITVNHFDAYRAVRHAKGRHPYTRFNEGVVIKQFLKWAKSRRMIADNPLAEVKLVKPHRDRHPAPDMDEVNRLLAALPLYCQAAIALLAFAGVRAGELQRLQTDDVDLKRGWIHVVSRMGLETKTGKSRRIPVHPRLRAYLKQVPMNSPLWFFTEPGACSQKGTETAIDIRRLNAEFKATAKTLGMKVGRKDLGYTLHSLRHFFETFTINARTPQRVVDVWMGHIGDRSTSSMYYQLSEDESKRFMNEVPFGTDI